MFHLFIIFFKEHSVYLIIIYSAWCKWNIIIGCLRRILDAFYKDTKHTRRDNKHTHKPEHEQYRDGRWT